MIDRENLIYIKNILSLNNNRVDLDFVYEILSCIKEDDNVRLFEHLLNLVNKDIDNIDQVKDALIPLLHAIKEDDEFSFYTILLKNKNFDTQLLDCVLKTIKHNKELQEDVFDSYSSNQLTAKRALLNRIDSLSILNKNSTVFIWGCWYGSVLIPLLANKVKKIIALDLDETAIKIGKKFFGNYENVDFQCADIFEKYLNSYKEADLIINTSCEHMFPMKDWKWFGPGAIEEDTFKGLKGEGFGSSKLSSNCYFAFQSNNMFGIEGHTNCVINVDEFKSQLPDRAEIIHQDEVNDSRGTRYMLIGKFNPI